MTVFLVETYVVKPEKKEEFISALKKILKYKKANLENFKEMKSKKVFSQMFGGSSDGYIELNEFDTLAEVEKYLARTSKDKGFMKLYQEAKQLLVPATYSLTVWNLVI